MCLEYDGPDQANQQNPRNGELHPPEVDDIVEESDHSEAESSMTWPCYSVDSEMSFSGYTADSDDSGDSNDTEISSLSSYAEELPDAVETNVGASLGGMRVGEDVFSVVDNESTVEAIASEEVRAVPDVSSVVCAEAAAEVIDIEVDSVVDAEAAAEVIVIEVDSVVDAEAAAEAIDIEVDSVVDAETAVEVIVIEVDSVVDAEAADGAIVIEVDSVIDAEAADGAIVIEEVPADQIVDDAEAGDTDRTYVSSGEEYSPHESCSCPCWHEAQEAKMRKEAVNKVHTEPVDNKTGRRGVKRKLEDVSDSKYEEAKMKKEAVIKVNPEPVGNNTGPRGVKRKQEDVSDSAYEEEAKLKRANVNVADSDAAPSDSDVEKKEVWDADAAAASGINIENELGADGQVAGPSGLQAVQAGYASDHTYVSSGEEYSPDESCSCPCWHEAQEAKRMKEEMEQVDIHSQSLDTKTGQRGVKRKQEDPAPDTINSEEFAEEVPEWKKAKLGVMDGDAGGMHVTQDEVSNADATSSAIDAEQEGASGAEAGPSGLQAPGMGAGAMDVAYDSDLTSGIEHSPRVQSQSTAKDTEPEPPRKTRRRRCKRSRRDRDSDSSESYVLRPRPLFPILLDTTDTETDSP
ncbi:hypothetical protein ZHAS_00004483 [Anopheles sinensis]|uniref:Uncharacterized protein n=1 Tax=Anopheles sinensis TaxID=74873 RepID=A0A084VH19_ANOSI|nr:hypothetical protein ZHAS_00004483 [Anopheles sinensis]